MALKFHKLSRPAIRGLTLGARITEHGITAERLSNGDVTYSINIMVDRQRIHRAVGKESDGVTREQAERLIETLRTRAREERLNLPKGQKTHLAFKDAAAEYLRRMEATGGRNMRSKRYHVAKVLIPYFGGYRADRITTYDVQRFVSARVATGLAQATVNRELATMSHIFRRMAKWGWMSLSDAPEVIKGSEPRKKIVILSDDESDRLMEAAASDTEDRLMLFVAFGLNTAMRHGEILRVRYNQIDLRTRRIFIPRAKAGEREQPITPYLAARIKAQHDADGSDADWLFPSTVLDGPYPHRVTLAKQFKRAVQAAGLQDGGVTPHVMRHTAITRLVKAGVDLPTIQRISGHKTLAMVLRYVHVHGDHIDQAIASIDTANRRITPELRTRRPTPKPIDQAA